MQPATFAENRHVVSTTQQFEARSLVAPKVRASETDETFPADLALSEKMTTFTKHWSIERPVLNVPLHREAGSSASLIQVWEGTVQEVLPSGEAMSVLLRSKLGGSADHFADIDFEWVSDQDRDLIKPGAVFYLSLYKERRPGGSIKNSEELRFRRLPAWTRRDASLIRSEARRLLEKGVVKPEAS